MPSRYLRVPRWSTALVPDGPLSWGEIANYLSPSSTLLETNFITDVFSYVAEVISLKWARPSKWCFNELCIMT